MFAYFSPITDSLKNSPIWWAISAVLSFVAPISHFIESLFILFIVNILVGIVADHCLGNPWSKSKLKQAFFEALLIYTFIFVLFSIGNTMNKISEASQIVAYFTWVVMWYYGANINRNFIIIAPNGSKAEECFKFSYYVVTFEMVKKLPLLNNYHEQKNRYENNI